LPIRSAILSVSKWTSLSARSGRSRSTSTRVAGSESAT
jgi:hypothetical protein